MPPGTPRRPRRRAHHSNESTQTDFGVRRSSGSAHIWTAALGADVGGDRSLGGPRMEKRIALTFKDLREHLKAIEAAIDDVDPPMSRAELDATEVVIRVEADGELYVGGLYDVEMDAGCGEVKMLVLDGADDVVARTLDSGYCECGKRLDEEHSHVEL